MMEEFSSLVVIQQQPNLLNLGGIADLQLDVTILYNQ